MPEPVDSGLDTALDLALRGDTAAALPVVAAAAGTGDPAASASLAELSAYLWRWDDVIPNAGRLAADPFAVYAGNVFDDMVQLLGRAGRETGAWDQVADAARMAARGVGAILDRNSHHLPEPAVRAHRDRLLTVLDRLLEYAVGGGHAPRHGRIDIFNPTDPVPNRAAFDLAVARNPAATPAWMLAMAIGYGLDEQAIRLSRSPALVLTFDDTVFVAQALARTGRAEEAWQAIRDAWPRWLPVARCQVAPIAPLTDRLLAPLMTRDRAATLLRLPRAAPVWRHG